MPSPLILIPPPCVSSRAGGSRGGGRAGTPQPGGSGSPASSTWVTALRLLADYLIDEDVGVIRRAKYTLRLLLGTEEGKAALAQVDDATRPFLEVFADR